MWLAQNVHFTAPCVVARGRLSFSPQLSGRLLVSLAATVACVAMLGQRAAAAPLQDDPLAAAQELYTNAAYQDALGGLRSPRGEPRSEPS